MKKVKVLIPFIDKETSNVYVKGDEIEVSDKRLAEITSVNINMVLVIGDVEESKPRKATKKKIS